MCDLISQQIKLMTYIFNFVSSIKLAKFQLSQSRTFYLILLFLSSEWSANFRQKNALCTYTELLLASIMREIGSAEGYIIQINSFILYKNSLKLQL